MVPLDDNVKNRMTFYFTRQVIWIPAMYVCIHVAGVRGTYAIVIFK